MSRSIGAIILFMADTPNPIGGSDAVTICMEVTKEGYGKCVGFSDGAVQLLGYSASEMLGRSIAQDILDPEDYKYEMERAARAMMEGIGVASTRLGEFHRKNIVTRDRRRISCAVCGQIASCISPDTGKPSIAHVSTWLPLHPGEHRD